MVDVRYYDSKLSIDGTADELASMAERYTDDYSDEALEKIIDILQNEGKNEKAQRVAFELESRSEVNAHKFDLGRIKLWALDGMYQLVDSDEETHHLDVISERGKVIISVNTQDDRLNTAIFSLEKFLELSSDDFEAAVNSAIFYAQ